MIYFLIVKVKNLDNSKKNELLILNYETKMSSIQDVKKNFVKFFCRNGDTVVRYFIVSKETHHRVIFCENNAQCSVFLSSYKFYIKNNNVGDFYSDINTITISKFKKEFFSKEIKKIMQNGIIFYIDY